jgi:hypothetical protein
MNKQLVLCDINFLNIDKLMRYYDTLSEMLAFHEEFSQNATRCKTIKLKKINVQEIITKYDNESIILQRKLLEKILCNRVPSEIINEINSYYQGTLSNYFTYYYGG